VPDAPPVVPGVFTLEGELADLVCPALLVLGPSAREPDLAYFCGPVHLNRALVLARPGARPVLAYWTAMERGEATATGLPLMTPEELQVGQLYREMPDPVLRPAVVVERVLERLGVAPGRLAVAGSGPAGELARLFERLGGKGFRPVPANLVMARLRKTKTAAQVAQVRRAAAGTCAALRRVAQLLAAAGERAGCLWLGAERLTVGHLRRAVAETLAPLGLDQPEGNILAPAEEGALPHSPGSDGRVLRPGQTLVVDLFPRGDLFADCTRTFLLGAAPPAVAAAHRAVAAALTAAHRSVAPGVRGFTLQEEVCRVLAAAGFRTPLSHPDTTTGYVHGLGHGVGYELHEYPGFGKLAGAEGVLAVGDVLTLEPGLYDPVAGYGIRLEDLVYLGPDGPENLTPLPYDLDPRRWSAP
jgi:Xaa-Pro aminopeptidase